MIYNKNSFSFKPLYLLLVIIFIFTSNVTVLATPLPLTQFDLDSIDKSEHYRDPREGTTDNPTCVASRNFTKSVYLLGDSITEGSKNDLEKAFEDNGMTHIINGLASRSLTSGDNELNGLTILEDNRDNYQDVEAVVIALGTNGGLTKSNIADAAQHVRNTNNSAEIYWVNIGVDNSLRDGDSMATSAINQILASNAEELGYTVVDWSSTVNTYSSDESLGTIITADGYGVHPNNDGKKLFAQQILTQILAGNPNASGCVTSLSGNDNAEKVWNFMIEKGLQPFQAAGFMGNMQAEASFEPRRVEYPVARLNDPWTSADFPDFLSDTVPPCIADRCRPGYGIVQWTAEGRKDGLSAFALERGLSPGDLGLQLEYVWEEISNGTTFRGTETVRQEYFQKYGQVPVLTALLQTTTLEEATDLILQHYEIPANISQAFITRTGFANAWLVKFGSGGTN